jgi:peptidoglycan lytic transglycosylase
MIAQLQSLSAVLTGAVVLASSFPLWATEPNIAPAKCKATVAQQKKLDRSGKIKRGKASYYARRFAGRTMANGEPMNPQSNAAASRTLPLGTKALVTNLENGRSVEVEIKDRGPYVEGRTVDLTPKTAEDLGMKRRGVVPVEVAPIAVPQPDGSLLAGDGASRIELALRK